MPMRLSSDELDLPTLIEDRLSRGNQGTSSGLRPYPSYFFKWTRRTASTPRALGITKRQINGRLYVPY